MKLKLSTIILGGVTCLLLVMVIYIGTLLKGEKPTPITTIKKTKASSITYSKTLSLNSTSNTPIPSLAPTTGQITSPTPTSMAISPTNPAVVTFSPTPKKTLPTTGRADYTATIMAIASLLIFISFIY